MPTNPIRQAINYCLNNGEELTRYTEDGDLNIDNNAAQQQMRRIALGRKNWLFLDRDTAGRATAILFSMTPLAKRHGVNIFRYIENVLEHMPSSPMSKLSDWLPTEWLNARIGRTPPNKTDLTCPYSLQEV